MEAADEWLLQSLQLYRDLHTFELQAPTRLIEWARGDRVCVAGYGQSDGNEILQLIPPPTLLTKETQGLCPERDFKVECGGFSERPVYSLKYVPDTSLLVTSGPPDSSLQVWQVSAEDSGIVVKQPNWMDCLVFNVFYICFCLFLIDVIKSVSTIATENGTGQSWAKIATISARAPCVLHGSRLDRVQITEVESRKNVYTSASRGSEELSNLAFLDCNTLLLCCATGQLCLADIRQPQSLVEAVPLPSAPCSEQWCMGTRHGAQGLEQNSQPVARLSSRGLLTLTDLRKPSEFLALAKARVPSPDSGAEFLCVSWAPALEGYLAISGVHSKTNPVEPELNWGKWVLIKSLGAFLPQCRQQGGLLAL
ncbi:WD repeat-containing protein 73 [Lonchura striata]|uniref:WD repeat-containing protein 73 n=1 Tax=Lonchura striata TaxID=40157 RepID=A0A218VAW2_9PASE|nr:WD repeat-containing protein 73 [Lonchura striata domestica]